MTSFFDFCCFVLDWYGGDEFSAKNQDDAIEIIRRNADRLTPQQFAMAVKFVTSKCHYDYADCDGLTPNFQPATK